MKKIMIAMAIALLLPSAYSMSIGSGLTPDIRTEDFKPMIWLCGSRIVYDDNTEPGRILADELVERMSNYAFEGEGISWNLLVMDKNGVEKIKDVFVSIGPNNDARRMVPYTYIDPYCMDECSDLYDDCVLDCNSSQSCEQLCEQERDSCEAGCERTGLRLEANEIQVNCQKTCGPSQIPASCNARILEERITRFNPDTMDYYECRFTVETPLSNYGEYFVTIEAEDMDGLYNYADEVEYWYLNPEIALAIDGDLQFRNVRPGTSSYSQSLLVSNDADQGSGVMLDMFISGTDFYDTSSSGAMCPTTNQLSLDRISYYTSSGSYSTSADPRSDPEGYVGIAYGIGFNDPNPFYNNAEILQAGPMVGPYYRANILSPGADMALTFRLDLPEPCNGDFDDGEIYFWGEAV